jgi:enamine deaminase RidA (YjgF/YER057c/UK114 family)
MDTDKNQIEKGKFLGSLAYLLRETFEGSPEGQMSAYLDHGTGYFSTIDGLTAENASREISSMTIAAQTEHAKFYLDRLCEFMNGRTERVRWDDSWLIETVNDTEWEALRAGMRKSYENALKCLADVEDWGEERVGMAMGMIAHSAYHLGAIRQLAKMADDRS